MDESFDALLPTPTFVRNTLVQSRAGAFVDQMSLEDGARQTAAVRVGPDPRSTGPAFVNTNDGVMTEHRTPAQTFTVRDPGRLPCL